MLIKIFIREYYLFVDYNKELKKKQEQSNLRTDVKIGEIIEDE